MGKCGGVVGKRALMKKAVEGARRHESLRGHRERHEGGRVATPRAQRDAGRTWSRTRRAQLLTNFIGPLLSTMAGKASLCARALLSIEASDAAAAPVLYPFCCAEPLAAVLL